MEQVRSLSLGIWVATGSRLESVKQEGLSHFIEHMLFKGTAKRTAKQVAESIEAVGGQLNAFTSVDSTCFYTKTLDQDAELACDVLTDIFYHSLFDAEEIEKEKGVVIEEIKMYEDTPDELIHDVFAQEMWQGHPLGHSVLGPVETVRSFDRTMIQAYMAERYTPEHVIITAAGSFDREKLLHDLEPFALPQSQGLPVELGVPRAKVARRTFGKDTEQLHMIVGVPGLKHTDEDIYALLVINNVLGGGASSRLFQEIREQRGLAYSVYSYHHSFADAGLFAIYAGTGSDKGQEVLDCILAEVERLRTEGLPEEELARTKAQLIGGMYLSLESTSNIMSRLGRSLLNYGRVRTPEEVATGLQKVTVADVQRTLTRLWQKDRVSVVTIGKGALPKVR
jgi:predicted Zn-dependent peptidase